jgi:hypothetical protein
MEVQSKASPKCDVSRAVPEEKQEAAARQKSEEEARTDLEYKKLALQTQVDQVFSGVASNWGQIKDGFNVSAPLVLEPGSEVIKFITAKENIEKVDGVLFAYEYLKTLGFITLVSVGGGIGVFLCGGGMGLSIIPSLLLLRGTEKVDLVPSVGIGMFVEAAAFGAHYFKDHKIAKGVTATGLGAVVGGAVMLLGESVIWTMENVYDYFDEP